MTLIPNSPLPTESTDLSTYPTTALQQIGFFVVFFFPALSLAVVSLRAYSRFSARTFGWDDGFIVAAMMTALTEAGCNYVMMKMNYIGVHTWQMPLQPMDRPWSQIWAYVVIVLYNPQLGLVKSSVLFFLLRLGEHKPSLRWSIHLLNISNILLMISVFMVSVLTCVPVRKYWHRDVPGHCNNEGLQYIITSSITVLTDILVVILPIKIVLGLQMPRRLKMGLTLVLTLGIIVSVVSILRLFWLIEYHFGGLFQKPDFSYDIRFVYSTVECNLAIICASIPALSSLLKKWFPNFFAQLTSSSSGGRKGQSPIFFFRRRDVQSLASSKPTSSHVIRTFGGGTVVVKDLPASPQASHPCSPLYPKGGGGGGDSDDEGTLFEGYNIWKTTKVDVSYNDAGSVRSGDLARSASKFRYQQSMRAFSNQ